MLMLLNRMDGRAGRRPYLFRKGLIVSFPVATMTWKLMCTLVNLWQVKSNLCPIFILIIQSINYRLTLYNTLCCFTNTKISSHTFYRFNICAVRCQTSHRDNKMVFHFIICFLKLFQHHSQLVLAVRSSPVAFVHCIVGQ